MKGGSFKKVLNQTYFGVFLIFWEERYDQKLLNAWYSIFFWSLLLTIFFLNLRDLRILTWTSASEIRSLDEVFKDGWGWKLDVFWWHPKIYRRFQQSPNPPRSFIPRYYECSPGAKKNHNESYGQLNKNIRTSLFGRHMLSWWWLFVLQWRNITHQKTVVSVLLSNSLLIRKMNSSQWTITETTQPSSFCPISSLNLILMLLCIRCFR